jgi:hypothetical protein
VVDDGSRGQSVVAAVPPPIAAVLANQSEDL